MWITSCGCPYKKGCMCILKYLVFGSKVKQLFTDGRRITTYPNGTKMEISTDKKTMTVTFYNGDIKKILADQTVVSMFVSIALL